MNTTLETSTHKPRAKQSVLIIVEREFMGNKTLEEAMLPVIIEDLCHKAGQNRSFDMPPNIA